MKHIVQKNGREIGWADGNSLSSLAEGVVFFDTVYVKYRDKQCKVGKLKVGFDRAEIFRCFEGEPEVLVGTVGRDGTVLDASGNAVGSVAQDVWSEMYANAGGAACVFLLSDEEIVARARDTVDAQIDGRPVERSASPNECRDSHVFGSGVDADERKTAVEQSPEVCHDSHVFGQGSESGAHSDPIAQKTESIQSQNSAKNGSGLAGNDMKPAGSSATSESSPKIAVAGPAQEPEHEVWKPFPPELDPFRPAPPAHPNVEHGSPTQFYMQNKDEPKDEFIDPKRKKSGGKAGKVAGVIFGVLFVFIVFVLVMLSR